MECVISLYCCHYNVLRGIISIIWELTQYAQCLAKSELSVYFSAVVNGEPAVSCIV